MTFTSVPLKPETLRRLKGYKIGGKSYDELLNDFMDDHPPETFMREHFRRLAEDDRVSWSSAKAKLSR